MFLDAAERTESQEYVAYLAEQVETLRASAHGLTEEQARSTPTRSALSVAGILKHVTRMIFDGTQRRLERTDPRITQAEMEEMAPAFFGSFTLTDDETLAGLLTEFDTKAERYLATLAGLDPDEQVLEPNRLWMGETEPRPARQRFMLVHQVEELARHAGHADIIREQIDGATSPELVERLRAERA